MSNTAELLALMTPHGVDVGHIPGGKSKLTGLDIAGALGSAHLPRGQYELLLAKYCGDNEALNQLYYSAYQAAVEKAVKYKWRAVRGKPYIRTISKLAVDEVVQPHRCDRCDGTGLNRMARPCKHCGGTGVQREPSSRHRAHIAEIPVQTWRDTWERRFNEMVMEIRAWEGAGLAKLNSQLRDC